MKKGFYTIMTAQFFSSLADNALLLVAIALLRQSHAPSWHVPALVPMFALFYVLLAPVVGAFADAMPKGRVMFIANSIKVLGCLMMLGGHHPLLSYAVVGLGAAAYSPAKYGILTELLPPSQLVRANGWIEGLTIASIVLGVLLGGQMISPAVMHPLDQAFVRIGVDFALPVQASIVVMGVLYVIAAGFNLGIPRTEVPMIPLRGSVWVLITDFMRCNAWLWRDKLGQITLGTTTLFWGVSGNLRVIVFAWAAVALGYTTTQASSLVGVVAIGTAVGAVAASMLVRLPAAPKVIPLGAAMGIFLMGMVFIDSVWMAIPFLLIMGAIGGFMVVPMNALLQHRGHNLMGAGRSIAVQNFNEQACILMLGGLYALLERAGVSAYTIIVLLGATVTLVMAALGYWHHSNLRRTPGRVQRLLRIAEGGGH
ncbi:lysophospholipid transporter LplT [Amphibiibacter pelophylacis]|uniref:Lysophospholipid transporter LplT n=1 Tax=Amphibiibacter pelophylacis TaxID=1799477 RepID=A0ACC6P0N1_9BURK